MKQAGVLRPYASTLAVSAAIAGLVLTGVAVNNTQAASLSVTLPDNPNCASYTPSGSGSSYTFTCVAAAPAGAPTGCQASVTTTPQTLTTAGGSATIAVNGCQAAAGSTITYNYLKGSSPGALATIGTANTTTATYNDANGLAANSGASGVTTYYQVSACVGSNCVSVPGSAIAVTVPGTGAGGGGGGGGGSGTAGSCPGFTKTLSYTWDWTAVSGPITFDTYQQTLGTNGAVVIQFTVPPGPTGLAASGSISTIEYPGNAMILPRVISLSTTPCDFGATGTAGQRGIDPSLSFYVGPLSWVAWMPGINSGQTYYINIANQDAFGNSSCVPGTNYPNCDIRITLSKPRGY